MNHKFRFLFTFVLISAFTLSAIADDTKTTRISRNFNILNSVLRELDLNYVDTLNYDAIMKEGIDKMLEKVDPYTTYIPESQMDDLTYMTSGEYGGIGALISKDADGRVVVSEPYEDKPAQKNGIRAGDVILEVDGVSTKNLSVSQVSDRLRGLPNTEIKLKLERLGEKKPIEKVFKREKIVMNSVSYYSEISPKVGYILLSDFTDHAAIEVKSALSDLVKNNKIESLILDLRDNGGGLVDEAVKILSYFLPKGTTVMSTKGKLSSSNRVYKTPTEPVYPDMKLVVLTNNNSASASEIIAGAVQDLDRGLIVGNRTFGKGLVQSIRPISFGGYIKVTTAKYYIPSGRCIQAIDYSHRNEDGSIARVPDSLTTEFKTLNGRTVRDGGGVVPDTTISDERKLNIAYYIYAKNLYFEFANQYVQKHPVITLPDKFELSDADFKAFTDFLVEKNFTYTSQTEKYFDELQRLAEFEGIDKRASEELEALKKKLSPDITADIEENKEDIVLLLSSEIIKRYYFQKGEIIYALRNDKETETAIYLLNNSVEFDMLLSKK